MGYIINGVKWIAMIVMIYGLSLKHCEAACRPTISDSTKNETNVRLIECGIAFCTNVVRVVYEKTGVSETLQRTPVFAATNKTQYQALDTGGKYSLAHRTDYAVFSTKHMLYIKPLIQEDQGLWSCVVFVDDSGFHESAQLDISIYVTPTQDNMNITPSTQALVTDQIAHFTCIVDGINPEPEVMWEVNGEKQTGGIASNKKRRDELWVLNNTFTHRVTRAGVSVIRCIMKHINRDPWVHTSIVIDVKESAKVSYPEDDVYITASINSTFTLNCAGSGFKPTLFWLRDDVPIYDDNERYIITRMCDDTTCTGSITARSYHSKCVHEVLQVYKCVIASQPPYQSMNTSPFMTVSMPLPQKRCSERHDGDGIELAIMIPVSAVLLILAVVGVSYACCKKSTATHLRQKYVHKEKTGEPDKLIIYDKLAKDVPLTYYNNKKKLEEGKRTRCFEYFYLSNSRKPLAYWIIYTYT